MKFYFYLDKFIKEIWIMPNELNNILRMAVENSTGSSYKTMDLSVSFYIVT